jgi:hypothetical protein
MQVFNKNVTGPHAPVISKPRRGGSNDDESRRLDAANLLHPCGDPPKMRDVARRSNEFREGEATLPSAMESVSNLVRDTPIQPALFPFSRWRETP